MRPRAAVVLIHDGRIALIERMTPLRHYWVLPGGGIEHGESAAEAASREALEELGIAVTIVGHLEGAPSAECFLAECETGAFGPVTGPEAHVDADDVHVPRWVEPARLAELALMPPQLKEWLMGHFAAGAHPWAEEH
jgi:8-oxo-dGTP diphosphatase